MKKILISDYDKTLYTNDENMAINVKMIEEFRGKGNLFVIATGRSFIDFKRKIEEYSIPYDYLILGHGSVVLNNKNELIKYFEIDGNIARSIINDASKYTSISKTGAFSVYEQDITDFENNIITKISLWIQDLSEAESIMNEIKTKYSSYVNTYLTIGKKYKSVEVVPNATDKSKAINIILDIEKIKDENVYAIGDSSNDIEMISKYNGYGMESSDDCIIKIAKRLYNNVHDLIKEIL